MEYHNKIDIGSIYYNGDKYSISILRKNALLRVLLIQNIHIYNIGDSMVLNRKKMIFILVICLILVFICMYKESNASDFKAQNTVQTNGTPVSSHTVILDAGHGEPDRAVLYLIMESLKKQSILLLC